jgi:hypothetical protein
MKLIIIFIIHEIGYNPLLYSLIYSYPSTIEKYEPFSILISLSIFITILSFYFFFINLFEILNICIYKIPNQSADKLMRV